VRGQQETSGIDARTFRATLGSFATGVSVMTTVVGARPHGMTANALASVSLDPPLVLVCVDRGAVMAGQVEASGVFALNFLARDQEHLSAHFANDARMATEDEFAGIAYDAAATGSPVLEGVIGWVDCRVWSIVDGGDHLVVVGEVQALDIAEGDPLLYFRAGYGGLVREGA